MSLLDKPHHQARVRQRAEASGGRGGDPSSDEHGDHAVQQHDEGFVDNYQLICYSLEYKCGDSLESVRWERLDWTYGLPIPVHLHRCEPLLFPVPVGWKDVAEGLSSRYLGLLLSLVVLL